MPSMDIGVREICEWHKARGYHEIGYHFVIRRDGTVSTGRDLGKQGAHAQGNNHDSIGICLIGGINDNKKAEANFTRLQMAALERTLYTLLESFPSAKVRGHRDYAATECPSFDVRAWWEIYG